MNFDTAENQSPEYFSSCLMLVRNEWTQRLHDYVRSLELAFWEKLFRAIIRFYYHHGDRIPLRYAIFWHIMQRIV